MSGGTDRLYNVNIKRLALLTLPTWLRRPLSGALLYAGVAPLGRMLQELRAYRRATEYRLSHNGQVCKLRGVLNDEFDSEQRRIKIEDSESAANVEASTIWMREKGRWVMLQRRGGWSSEDTPGGLRGHGLLRLLDNSAGGTADGRDGNEAKGNSEYV